MKYDLAIVGGGIVGTGIARDAALRGLRVLLIEKEDFAAGTTSRSTRLIHGGLRYLGQYDFGLVYEALHERRALLKIAPHLVRPLPFLLPVYRGSGHSIPFLWSGITLYDFMSPWRSVPHHRFLPANLCLRVEPSLKRDGLRGGFLFYDGQCAFPERLCLENAIDAAEHGATLLNHSRVIGFERAGKRIRSVRIRNELTKEETAYEADLVLNCAGPWLDDVDELAKSHHAPLVRRTKGVHLVVPKINEHALILETRDVERVIFAIPWGDYSLIGTTDTDYEGSNEDVRTEREDVDYLLAELGAALSKSLERSDILFTTAGLRPLVRDVGTTTEISRRHEIVDHAVQEGLGGYATVVGGKITNYRLIAEEATDFVVKKLDKKVSRCRTAVENLPGGRFEGSWNEFLPRFLQRAAQAGISADVARHLADHYGGRALAVLERIRAHPEWGERLDPEGPWVWAQVVYAVEQENALTLTDVLLRRLSIGLSRGQGRMVASAVARFLGKRLRWSPSRIDRELEAYLVTLDRNWIAQP